MKFTVKIFGNGIVKCIVDDLKKLIAAKRDSVPRSV